jgi:sigma-B regulation protein RsbU (phosphoserine phosphatase)
VPSAAKVFLVELVVGLGLLAFLLTGSRGRFLDRLHPRADALVVLALSGLVGATLLLFVRRILPEWRRRITPASYDHQAILLDLADVTRRSQNIAEIYKFSVETIAAALKVPEVSLFVRDEPTGNFVTVYASGQKAGGTNGQAAEGVSLRQNAFVVRRLSKLHSPLRLQSEDLDVWKRAAGFIEQMAGRDRETENSVLRQLNARLLVQIRNRVQLTGILVLGPRESGFDFLDTDLKMLMSIAEQLSLVIDNAHLLGRIVDQEKMLHEMALAASVQKHLFPEEAPQSSAIQISGYCKPAGLVGGDYYDFMEFENQNLAMAVADVAGKGLAAALLTFMIHAFLRSQALAGQSPAAPPASLAQIASALNRLLFASTGSSSFVTLFYARYDKGSGRLSFVNAGHNPPFILHSDRAPSAHSSNGSVVKLAAGGPMLGLFQDCPVQESELQMKPGDCLVAYTDGAIEAANVAGEEFGEDRLLDLVKSNSHLPAATARDEILRRIDEWSAGAPQLDDITLLVLKVDQPAA